ncbi:MAG TPA: hypothetical protein VL200_01550 [Lacunisphaera sp.]|jgi:hypothetical protein|nr:hypothetical protein [Lacunisphaera sp.]
MKISLLLAGWTLAVLGGCESVSSRVQEHFTAVEPHAQVYPQPRKVVFAAAQKAVKNVGLQLGRSSIAKGTIEGYADIRAANSTDDARQTTIRLKLSEADDGGTRVELLVYEQTEGGFPGGVSEKPLREHSLYDLYFAALQQLLSESAADRQPGNS